MDDQTLSWQVSGIHKDADPGAGSLTSHRRQKGYAEWVNIPVRLEVLKACPVNIDCFRFLKALYSGFEWPPT